MRTGGEKMYSTITNTLETGHISDFWNLDITTEDSDIRIDGGLSLVKGKIDHLLAREKSL